MKADYENIMEGLAIYYKKAYNGFRKLNRTTHLIQSDGDTKDL
jgi:hypothetical protein